MTSVTILAGAVEQDSPGRTEAVLDESGRLPVCPGIVGSGYTAPLKGCALRLAETEDARDIFEIALIDHRDTCVMVLGQFEEDEVVAVWRRLAAQTGLLLMLENPDGSLSAPYPQVGAVQLGAIRIRRRHGLLNGRRPRFLTRRKTGRQPARPLVYREREIVTGTGSPA